MQLDEFHLGYCTNIHPGESLDDIEGVLLRHAMSVKQRVMPDAPFGLGLRLGNAAASTLAASPDRCRALAERLSADELYVFTVNGFPYGDFAARSLKDRVYEPSWLDPERVAYTRRLAEVTARLPGPDRRTISTVGGGFRPRTDTDEAKKSMAVHLGEAARHLHEVADRTGVHIRLCLEPEPCTTLETTDDAIAFFERYLHPIGEAAHDHLGLCYDCCHQAVLFEDAADSLRRLRTAGVDVGKVQVSSALHLANPADPDARAALLAFAEPRYLHQVVGRRTDAALLRAVDLPELREPDAAWIAADAWRCHFHVPIWWRGDGRLGTTRDDWESVVREIAADGHSSHLEIETYTWDVIPPEERARLEGGDLHACIASEFAVLRDVLGR